MAFKKRQLNKNSGTGRRQSRSGAKTKAHDKNRLEISPPYKEGADAMLYTTEVTTSEINTIELFDKYCMPDKVLPLCKDCPDYARVWSCPPGVPNSDMFKRYPYTTIIGVKVIYAEEALAQALTSPEDTEAIRADTYGKVKRRVLSALLNAEKLSPPSHTIAAGRCEICGRCARIDGLTCRNPWALRYSFSALGFDLGHISEDLLGIPLLWTDKGLPRYNMAIYAFLSNNKAMQDFHLS